MEKMLPLSLVMFVCGCGFGDWKSSPAAPVLLLPSVVVVVFVDDDDDDIVDLLVAPPPESFASGFYCY